MQSLEIRKRFFDFFKKHDHTFVPSSSLIPAQDPTLLFANAGMNQFKDVFLGLEKRSYNRAVTIQKCVRAGGKHNDLDNVGFTKRHLTFFEMMGNFSFGDYFKKQAITLAWDFLTQELGLPQDQLHVSVFETDNESYALWHYEIGLPAERIHRLGAEHNFWQMGDTGPCGPCTEIYIDRGPAYGGTHFSDPLAHDRYLEVWNLVFMQYDRQPDGTDKPLKQTGVDTGMGLERLCSIMQNKSSVFQTDLFAHIIAKTENLTNIVYADQPHNIQAAFHVLADHIRSASMLIADGASPSNEGRGYVLRKIIRRAALFAQKLTNDNIFPQLSHVVVEDMSSIYPELKNQRNLIHDILHSEIHKFATNLTRGKALLNNYFAQHKEERVVSGAQAFKLYDTFGFPLELITIMAQEHHFSVDLEEFQKQMNVQKEQSGKKLTTQEAIHVDLDPHISTEFTGYQELKTLSRITALIVDNQTVDRVKEGTPCWVIVEKSPFFIVGGGQVPDQGWLLFDTLQAPLQEIRYIGNAIAAKITAPLDIQIGMQVTSRIDKERRTNAMKNHTATHLLQAALIQLFGKQIRQSGSLVHPDYLRFDFTYHESLKSEDIGRIENLVNKKIRENIPVTIEYTTLKDATNRGVIAFFGDKYNPDQVRIVQINSFSAELCGGTHVSATGAIGTFKIIESTALSAGHRRIFAVTGPQAISLFQESFNTIKNLSQEFKVKREEVPAALEKQRHSLKSAQTEIRQLKQQLIHAYLPTWIKDIEQVQSISYLFLSLSNMSPEDLKEIAHQLNNTHPGFYFLTTHYQDKSLFYAYASSSFISKEIMQHFCVWLKKTHKLQGGGSNNTLQGSGTAFDPHLKESIKTWLGTVNFTK